jgi:hypothetical protein
MATYISCEMLTEGVRSTSQEVGWMPRESPFVITLSTEEKRILAERARKYTLPYFSVLRAKMILLAAEGMGNDVIAARLDVGRDVVSQWRKRFFEQRLPGLEEGSRSGRPRVFPPGGRRAG